MYCSNLYDMIVRCTYEGNTMYMVTWTLFYVQCGACGTSAEEVHHPQRALVHRSKQVSRHMISEWATVATWVQYDIYLPKWGWGRAASVNNVNNVSMYMVLHQV